MDAIQNTSFRPANVVTKKQAKNVKKPETQQVEVAKSSSPSGAVWQAMVGINTPKQSDKLINKFAITGKLGLHDIANLKKAVKEGNAQAENVSMLLSLVDEKAVNARTLRYVCKDGIMSDGMEKDVRTIFEAKANGIDPKDAYIPHYETPEAGLENAETGDIFEVEGQKNVFIKNREGKAEQLKMDKEMMCKLFPPAERFANAQTHSADCYFVSTVNSMMDNPNARPYFLQCFEQDGNDVKINFPSSDFVYTAKDAKMPKAYKGNFVTGSTGMKLVEYAYGEFLEDLIAKQVRQHQIDKIAEFKDKLSTETDPQARKNLESKIDNYQTNLDRFNQDQARTRREFVVPLDSERQPEFNDNEGVTLRSLDQMNRYRQTSYQSAGDYYRGDGGFMEDVFKDFGYQHTEAYSMDDPEIKDILMSPDANEKYIFSGGTKNQGRRNPLRAELIIDRSLSMYGAHAYRVAPSTDENGNVVFKVSNPWNSSHNAVLTMAQMEEFFSQIHIAEIV